MSELEKMTLTELKKLAKDNNIRNISKLKKEELIDILGQIHGTEESTIENSEVNDINQSEKFKKYDAADDEAESEEQVEESVISYQVNNEEDEIIEGILEVLPDGYGFLRGDNFLSSREWC